MGNLFKPKMPEVAKPVRMPDPEDPETNEAEERKRRQIAARSGRTSTILSQRSGGGAGTQAFTNSLLGQAG